MDELSSSCTVKAITREENRVLQKILAIRFSEIKDRKKDSNPPAETKSDNIESKKPAVVVFSVHAIRT